MAEHTFKVGDRVRVTLELSERYGQTGVIVNRTQVYRRPIFTYEVEFETENPKGWNKDSFMTHELEPAPATHRFPVGAVVVLKTDFQRVEMSEDFAMTVVEHLHVHPLTGAEYRLEFSEENGNKVSVRLHESSLQAFC